MVSNSIHGVRTELHRRNVGRPKVHQRIWMLGIWGIGPLIVAIALTIYAFDIGWFWGAILGLSWLANILFGVGFIFWATNRDDSNENNRKTV